MVIAVNTVLGWCRAPANTRVALTTALMPGGMSELADFSIDEIKEATKSFSRMPIGPFVLSPHTTKRLVQLTLWVKDQERLAEDPTFPNGTTQAEFVALIDDAQRRDKIRKERQKTAESLASVRIDPPLKSSAGWEGWMVAVEAALTLAYGSKGVPLAYIIRTDEAPQPNGHATWELKAINAAPLQGLDYEADRMTVHLFILNNVSEESDAYTYIQPLLRRNDGRRDVLALRERYENDATIQTRVNMANKTWDLLVYKNERAMTFEDFCKKFQRALQHFDRAGRPKHAGDITDWIWGHIQNPELGQTIAALKASQALNQRTPAQILQEVAKEIPNLSKSFQRVSELEVSELKEADESNSTFTFDGDTPKTGAHNSDGKLYCGSYSHGHWFSDDMNNFREEIMSIREQHPELRPSSGRNRGGYGGGKGGPNRRNQHKKHQVKVKELKLQNEQLKLKLASLKSDEGGGKESTEKGSNAGGAFGGRATMSRKPT
jgi:hypothetical protein